MIEYLKHDFHSRHDPKISFLRRKHRSEAVDLFWCLVEVLYEQGGYVDDIAIEGVAAEIGIDDVSAIIDTMLHVKLIVRADDGSYTSNRVLKELAERELSVQRKRQAASSRWDKKSSVGTNVSAQPATIGTVPGNVHGDTDSSVDADEPSHDLPLPDDDRGVHRDHADAMQQHTRAMQGDADAMQIGTTAMQRREEKKREKKRREECVGTGPRARPDSLAEVEDFMQSFGLPASEANSFILHYDGIGWVRGNAPIRDWKSIAELWVGTYTGPRNEIHPGSITGNVTAERAIRVNPTVEGSHARDAERKAISAEYIRRKSTGRPPDGSHSGP